MCVKYSIGILILHKVLLQQSVSVKVRYESSSCFEFFWWELQGLRVNFHVDVHPLPDSNVFIKQLNLPVNIKTHFC